MSGDNKTPIELSELLEEDMKEHGGSLGEMASKIQRDMTSWSERMARKEAETGGTEMNQEDVGSLIGMLVGSLLPGQSNKENIDLITQNAYSGLKDAIGAVPSGEVHTSPIDRAFSGPADLD